MARFKLFPRSRRPGLGELLGISQVSRKHHLRIVRDPMSPLKNPDISANAGFSRGPMKLVGFLRGLFS
jgi:hypothetical protein